MRTISKMQFEWDAAKAAVNLAKHGISFEQAALVFADPHRLTVIDTRHTAEHRLNTTGCIQDQLFIVCHTDRAGRTRLISARPASRHERNRYHAHH
jgi:uncharacterized protein